MPLTVLSDKDVQAVINTLDRSAVHRLQEILRDALHSYSTALEPAESGCCAENQPSRIAIKGKNGATTLFMPAAADNASGCKIVTLSETNQGASGASTTSSYFPESSDSTTVSSTGSTSGTREGSVTSATSSSSASTKQSNLTVPIYDATTPLPPEPASKTQPIGSLTLLDDEGQPRAIVSAVTLTAFRTALASTLLFKLRSSVHDVAVFGAGSQAYWHIYLALLLRGDEIHHLNVINRTFPRAQRLYIQLARSENPAVQNAFLGGKLKFSILTPEFGEYTRLLKDYVRASDVIFCCTPSTTPLFPAGHLTHTAGRRKGRYIAAIGSYKPHMQELHVDILRQAVAGPAAAADKPTSTFLHLGHRHTSEGGAVVVDTIDGAMSEAGEIIHSGIGGRGIVELGELVMLKRSHWAEKAQREARERDRAAHQGKEHHHDGGHGLGHLFHLGHRAADAPADAPAPARSKSQARRDREAQAQHDGGLRDWLERGNVVYKSVGLGLMDVVVGMELVRIAEAAGLGTTVADF